MCYYDMDLKNRTPLTPTDGDFLVLTREGHPCKTVYIYKETNGYNHVCHATTCGNAIFCELKHGRILNYCPADMPVRLAFKEEKESFLESLKASGYNWDGEKIIELKGE